MALHPEVVVLVVLATIVGVLVVARRAHRPYPVLLVAAGLAVAWLPGMPTVRIDPEIVLLGVLPPLLFWPAFLSSPAELRAQARSIASLAIGLVLATTVAVAAFAHAVVGVRWDVAFVLGAVVSATDPVAAAATLRRIGVPRRVLVVLEGESLVNDAAALVAYAVAVEAVVRGTFSPTDAALRFTLGAAGGVAIGLAVGALLTWALEHVREPLNAITLVLFSAYFAYLPAELIGASGVLAAVAAGLLFGWREPRSHRANVRLVGYAFWEELVFLLHAFVFFAIGLELRAVLDGVREYTLGELARWTATVTAVTIGLRIAWVYLTVYVPQRRVRRDRAAVWRECAVKAWSGMRGVVSVAAALGLPFTTAAGRPFPARDLVIFLAYGTVVGTLLLQGGTLPAVARLLRVGGEDTSTEEARVRVLAAESALRRADELAAQPWVPETCLQEARRGHEERLRRATLRAAGTPDEELERTAERCDRLEHELLDAERDALVGLRERGAVDEDVYQRIQRELDLAHAPLDD
jgi:CPA1 family monovalent cation:H+ antiporter